MDEPDLLAAYLPGGAPFRFPAGDWPTPDGRHPWSDRANWQGHAVLMLQRPGDGYAVWVFWAAREPTFDCWYMNMQEPFRRTLVGYDTQDLELDIVVSFDGSWTLKDYEVLEQRIREGGFTPEQVAATRAEAGQITDDLDVRVKWWADEWAAWTPDPALLTPREPDCCRSRGAC